MVGCDRPRVRQWGSNFLHRRSSRKALFRGSRRCLPFSGWHGVACVATNGEVPQFARRNTRRFGYPLLKPRPKRDQATGRQQDRQRDEPDVQSRRVSQGREPVPRSPVLVETLRYVSEEAVGESLPTSSQRQSNLLTPAAWQSSPNSPGGYFAQAHERGQAVCKLFRKAQWSVGLCFLGWLPAVDAERQPLECGNSSSLPVRIPSHGTSARLLVIFSTKAATSRRTP